MSKPLRKRIYVRWNNQVLVVLLTYSIPQGGVIGHPQTGERRSWKAAWRTSLRRNVFLGLDTELIPICCPKIWDLSVTETVCFFIFFCMGSVTFKMYIYICHGHFVDLHGNQWRGHRCLCRFWNAFMFEFWRAQSRSCTSMFLPLSVLPADWSTCGVFVAPFSFSSNQRRLLTVINFLIALSRFEACLNWTTSRLVLERQGGSCVEDGWCRLQQVLFCFFFGCNK